MPKVRRAYRPAAAPDAAMPPAGSPSAGVEEHRFPCDTCGGDMRFDPASQGMECDHCGNAEALPAPTARARAAALAEMDLKATLAGAPAEMVETTHVTQCPNCGARFELDPAVRASECPFCATPVVARGGTDRHIRPAALLPFALPEDEARGKLKGWLASRWFAPNALRKYARAGRRMAGIYAPHWTFDAETETAYTGLRGIRRFETYTNAKGETQTRTRIDWYPARGRVRVAFDDLMVLGSASLPEPLTDGVAPWDLGAMEPYRPEVIAGFRAEAYTVDLAAAWARARERMTPAIHAAIRRDIGGDAQRIQDTRTVTAEETFKHVLLPLWIAAYRYGGKSYRFVVNGSTGKVAGERPYSWIKITLAALAAAILAALVWYVAEGGQLAVPGIERPGPSAPRVDVPFPSEPRGGAPRLDPPGGPIIIVPRSAPSGPVILREDDLRPQPLPPG